MADIHCPMSPAAWTGLSMCWLSMLAVCACEPGCCCCCSPPPQTQTHVGRLRSTRATPTVLAARFLQSSFTCLTSTTSLAPSRQAPRCLGLLGEGPGWGVGVWGGGVPDISMHGCCGSVLLGPGLMEPYQQERATYPRLCLNSWCLHEHCARGLCCWCGRWCFGLVLGWLSLIGMPLLLNLILRQRRC